MGQVQHIREEIMVPLYTPHSASEPIWSELLTLQREEHGVFIKWVAIMIQ